MTGEGFEAVLFDLDGTLCEYERAGAVVLERAFETADVEPFFGIEAYYERFDDHVAPDRSLSAIREAAFAAIARDRDRDPAAARAVAQAYEAERDYRGVRAIPGALDVLAAVSEAYPTGLVTNGPPSAQRPKLDALSIGDVFDTVVYAGFDTPPKPRREPFDRALAELDRPPGGTIYVGNSLAHDVAGARQAGLNSVWLDGSGTADPDPRPDHRIAELAELRGLLDRLRPA